MPTASVQWYSHKSLGLSGIEVEPCLGAHIVRLLGEHDLTTAQPLARTINAALDVSNVVVDLDNAGFIDAAIIHTLVDASHAASENGRQLRLALSPDHPLRRTLELVGHDITIIPGTGIENGKPDRRATTNRPGTSRRSRGTGSVE